MASTLKQAITDVLTRAALIDGVKFVAVFNNQVKMEQDGATFDFDKPAILVEIETPNTGLQTLGFRNVTVSDLKWRLSIVHEQLDAGNGTLDQNLDVFDYRDKVKKAFTGFMPTRCGQFQYAEESQDYAHNNIYVYSICFRSAYVDTKGSPLDPDADDWITKEPPIALDFDAYITTPQPPQTHIAYGWKDCRFPTDGVITIVETPNPGRTQQLANGDIVPLEYALNEDGTITIPELASWPGIVVLTPFMIGNQSYDTISIDYDTGIISNAEGGGFIIGNEISFNVTLPLYTPE